MNTQKKQYSQPQVSELGKVTSFVQSGGVTGAIDGPIVTISGQGYSPHASR